jgi:hemoglobin-like flavoprotein
MTPQQIRLVRESFADDAMRSPATGMSFYETLFRINPECRSMFSPDLDSQAFKLVQMLGMIVDGLDHTDSVLAQFRELGRRHAYYGVEETHFDDVGAALLQALHATLNDRFSAEVEDAWASVYAELAETMIMAARSQRAEFPVETAPQSVAEVRISADGHAAGVARISA